MGALRSRADAAWTALRARRPGPRGVRAIGLAGILGALALGGWLWLRDSSLVAVRQVQIAGVSGPDAGRIRAALRRAALNTTTLDLDAGALHAAVEPYAVVHSIDAHTHFPHGLLITVHESLPVARVVAGGRAVAVAADGTLLRDTPPSGSLPTITLTVPPVGPRLSDRDALAGVRILGAAPWQLLGRVDAVRRRGARGLVVELRNGPELIFGSDDASGQKWSAATGVLADAGARGAAYIDLTDPARPAAGVGAPGTPSTSDGTGTPARITGA